MSMESLHPGAQCSSQIFAISREARVDMSLAAIRFETAGWHGNPVLGFSFTCRKPESRGLNLSLHHSVPVAQTVEHGAKKWVQFPRDVQLIKCLP